MFLKIIRGSIYFCIILNFRICIQIPQDKLLCAKKNIVGSVPTQSMFWVARCYMASCGILEITTTATECESYFILQSSTFLIKIPLQYGLQFCRKKAYGIFRFLLSADSRHDETHGMIILGSLLLK